LRKRKGERRGEERRGEESAAEVYEGFNDH